MKLYDEIIEKILKLTGECNPYSVNADSADWPLISDRSLILRGDMAYELGADLKPGFGATILPDNKELVQDGEGVVVERNEGKCFAEVIEKLSHKEIDYKTLAESAYQSSYNRNNDILSLLSILIDNYKEDSTLYHNITNHIFMNVLLKWNLKK